jgi:hypothetical protein
MLEHQKKVLLGVAKNPYLFKKELAKSLIWLSETEQEVLSEWVKKEFSSYHMLLMQEIDFGITA